jgi:hypothetical protein
MQLKVFHIDGQPHLATRDGAFFETAATLESLIAERLEEQQQADLTAWEASSTALPQEAEAVAPASAVPEVPATVPDQPAADPVEDAPAPVLAALMVVAPLAPQHAPKGNRGARWTTAGAERRGRVAQHWSVRRKA